MPRTAPRRLTAPRLSAPRSTPLRALPSVDALLRQPLLSEAAAGVPRGLLLEAVRAEPGAEAALVVNNGAAAILLALAALAHGHKVIVSRGELVEIGGSFRVPEVMEKSGATLLEVGATNRTHLADYRKALERDRDVAAI